MTDEGGSTLTKRQLGRYLRDGRSELGATLEEVAAMMQWSKSKLCDPKKLQHVRRARIRRDVIDDVPPKSGSGNPPDP
ncbi:helix-turn-helix domain-containing protein [Nocardia sp. NPDC004573]